MYRRITGAYRLEEAEKKDRRRNPIKGDSNACREAQTR
jgi:hypothetical protein